MSSTRLDKAALIFVLLSAGFGANVRGFHTLLTELKTPALPGYSTISRWMNDKGASAFRQVWPGLLAGLNYENIKTHLPACVVAHFDPLILPLHRLSAATIVAYTISSTTVLTHMTVDPETGEMMNSKHYATL